MSILSSFYTGVSGLTAQGEALSVYSDNIANADTKAFKVSRPEFQDLMAKSLKGELGGNQIGRGVKLSGVSPLFTQGSVVQTESPTDLAIHGDGFFILKGKDGESYTRNGAFHFDKTGKLLDSDGNAILGFQADENGLISSKLGEILLNREVMDAKKTNEIKLHMNLDLRAEKNLIFDQKHPERTSHFSTGLNVYDSTGTAHVCNVYFNKANDNTWTWRAMINGEEAIGGNQGEQLECANGSLSFDSDGKLQNQQIEKSSFNFTKGAVQNQYIKFNFGEDKLHGGNGIQVTQYGTNSETYKSFQDGYASGSLLNFSFGDDGKLTAIYSNQENIDVAQIALAKFENTEALFKLGQNRFRESRLSGIAKIGSPQTGGRGKVTAKSIESSNTDIASEFVNLMLAQRNFQANSKVMTTSDEMLHEILNLRRS